MLTWVVLASALAPVDAAAQDAPEEVPADPHAEAIRLFEESERAYDRGDMADAVALLQRAYALEPAPVLLYNLARAYEASNRSDEAIDAYERYLDQESDVHDRGALERRVAALRAQREELRRLERERRRAVTTAPPPAPPEPVEAPGPSAWPWVIASVGAAGIGAAVGLSVHAVALRDAAEAEPEHRAAAATWQEAQDFAFGANVTYAVAGGVALIAAVWGLVDVALSSGSSETGAAFRIRRGALAWRWP